ncbi:MAG: SPASM domain-containing protein [Halanaerobiales bacterium]|nr:SPASM domain-containing protein [Halanaerobiales bacterium]
MELLLPEIYRFKVNDKSIIIDVRRGIYGEERFLKELINRSIVPDRKLRVDIEKFLVNSLYLHISEKCSLRCTYCYLDSSNKPTKLSEMNENQIDEIIFFLKNSSLLSANVYINFLGREPLENFDLIKYTVNKLEEMNFKNFHYTIGTNGLLLNKKEIVSFLYRYFSSIVVSLDGTERIHNQTRKFSNGKGSYESITKNIAYLNNRPKTLKFGLRAIVGKNPVKDELVNIVKHHQKFNPDTIFIDLEKTQTQWSEERITVTKEAIYRLWLYFLEKAEEGVILPIRHILSLLRKVSSGRTVAYNCDAGTTSIYVTSDCEIYPCGELANCRQWKIGSTKENKINQTRFLENTVQNRENCKDCWARYICGGKCYADNSGNCEIIQFEIQLAMYVSIYLLSNHPDLFKKIYDVANKKIRSRGVFIG